MIPAKPGDPPHAIAREAIASASSPATGSNPPDPDPESIVEIAKTRSSPDRLEDIDDFSSDTIEPGASFAPRNEAPDRPRTREDQTENSRRFRDDHDRSTDRPRTRDESIDRDPFTRNETDPGASFARDVDRSDPFPLKNDMLKHVRESASTGYRPRPNPSNPPSPPADSAPPVDWICTDLSGQGWRHSDRAFLERWVAERNAALSAPRSTPGFFIQYQTCAGGRCR